MTGDGTAQRETVLRVRGHVQGVNYRVSARRKAAELGIVAEPVNLPDGTVRIRVIGDAAAVRAFHAWCHDGPPAARVDSVEEEASVNEGG